MRKKWHIIVMETERLQKIEKIEFVMNFEYMRHNWFRIKKISLMCKVKVLSQVSDRLGTCISCYQEKHHPSIKIKVLIKYITQNEVSLRCFIC